MRPESRRKVHCQLEENDVSLAAILNDLTEQLEQQIDLLPDQIVLAAQQLSDPDVPDGEKAAFLIALKQKGESGEELGGLAKAFLQLSLQPRLELDGRPTIDLVGTGGDRLELINVSTACMFVLAAAGVAVLKHGNRAITSRCGAADILEQLGIPIECPMDLMVDCVQKTGVGFFFAPLYHPSFRFVAPVRKRLAEQGIATVFNLLGPLLNPARPSFQLTGVFSPTIIEKYAVALRAIGRTKAWVVHGHVAPGLGMDEISLLGETYVQEVNGDSLNHFYLFPDQLGFQSPGLHELRGGTPAENAETLVKILSNRDRGAKRDFIVINAAAALVIAGLANRMEKGIPLAIEMLESGAAFEKLREFQRFFIKS